MEPNQVSSQALQGPRCNLRCGDPHWLQDYDHKPKQDP